MRIEIESVLARQALRVFPLLVKGASLPIPDAVPPSLRALLRRHGYPTRRDPDFKSDIARLIVALDVTLGISRPVAKTRRLSFFGLGFLTAAALALIFDEQTFRIAEDGHDFIKHNYAKLTKQPLMAGRADLDRWKGSILALQRHLKRRRLVKVESREVKRLVPVALVGTKRQADTQVSLCT